MSEGTPLRNGRCLAEIENNLREAEQAFADADARYKQAENDRRVAVETINQHQAEIDDAVRQLRELSIPGTRWSAGSAHQDEPLVLHSEDIVSKRSQPPTQADDLASTETKQAISRDLERLRNTADEDESDPVLKVVANPRQ